MIISFAIYTFITRKGANQKNTPQNNQPSEPVSVPSENDEKMTVKTSGGDIEINNLYKNPVANLFQNGVLFRQTPDFEMSFYPEDQGFIITLLNPDLKKSRDEAEKEFLEALGIDKSQACFLKISLGTTSDISEKTAGRNFGLSFCPDGKPLPAE